MEHKLIQGGEQFLPFARSRIKALKATGLKYASQKFEIDGVSVKVRIAGEHEYIELEGDPVKILSGVIKTGEVIELPVPPGSPGGTLPKKTLRSYKPTQNAWDYPLKKDPAKPITSFNDERFLANAGTQYAGITPSMFSGLMAKVVAIVMGRGKPVIYDYRWSRCHGVFLAADGKPWLVEVSAAQGVMVMRLPMDKGSVKSKVDAIKQATLLFGGVPNGRSFPVGDKLVTAIADGKVLRLKTPAEMQPVFTKTTYSSAMGWSFSPTAGEAHNTCYHISAGIPYSSHYKLALSENVATLELVSQTELARFSFWFTDELGRIVAPTNATIAGTFQYSQAPREATIFVCHDEAGTLDVVRAKWTAPAVGPFGGQVGMPSQHSGERKLTFDDLSGSGSPSYDLGVLDGTVVSTKFPASAMTGAYSGSYTDTGYVSWTLGQGVYSFGRMYHLTTFHEESSSTVPANRYFGATIAGVRDGYVLQNAVRVSSSSSGQGLSYWNCRAPSRFGPAPGSPTRVDEPGGTGKYAYVANYIAYPTAYDSSAQDDSAGISPAYGIPPDEWSLTGMFWIDSEGGGFDPGYPRVSTAIGPLSGGATAPTPVEGTSEYVNGASEFITVLPRQTVTSAVSEAGTALWNALFDPYVQGSGSFLTGRVSVWGVQHTVLTQFPSYSATTYNLSGPLLAGEPNQTGAQYNFVGYT